MSGFVDTVAQTAIGSATRAAHAARKAPRASRLLRVLQGRKRILVTTHIHPDPDALASCLAMQVLLRNKTGSQVDVSVKGETGGGYNAAFTRHLPLDLVPWDESRLKEYDAIILLDTQPAFAYSPLPAEHPPLAVIDHHRARGKKPGAKFLDIRKDVGAVSSIVFSYFMELEEKPEPALASALVYAIESDLAGAAGTPGKLDNTALSTLTLLCDTRLLYRMRHVDLPQSYYQAYAEVLRSATFYGPVMIAHMEQIPSLETPAVLADFLLRFDQARWALVSGVQDNRLICSLRTKDDKTNAGDVMRKLVSRVGEGGGHPTKAGGFLPLKSGSNAELERFRALLKRRLLRATANPNTRGTRLT
jgi:nanoRNase/pAp phosphatase (c-di-AMP/oligoRNAs hydrolase)